jgi:hypothetical protein
MRKLRLVASAAILFTCIGATHRPPHGPMQPSLAQVRAATLRFRDVKAALAAGYVRDPMDECVTAASIGYPPSAGSMGIHFARSDLLGITEPPHPRIDGNGVHTDFLKPAILLYEPQKDGSLELVGVENLVFEKAWMATHSRPPSFHGVRYNRMADNPATPVDEGHMFQPHFDRHVWLYRSNPNGMYAQFNPRVNCSGYKSSAPDQGDKHMK